MRHLLAGLAMAWLATPAAAQDEETVYMGIDLTAEPQPVEAPGEPAPDQRELGAEMRPVLDEGVELGCLSFEPPATFSQTDNDSAECRDYMVRLTAAAAGTAPEQPADVEAEVVETDNPWRAIPLVTLARAAQSGNKPAQLELGIRFEEGIGGAEQNWDYALELYQEAGRATPAAQGIRLSGGTDEMGAPGRAPPRRATLSPRVPGLEEARDRRDALREQMRARDRE